MKKKISLFLISAFCFSLSSTAFAGNFTDVGSSDYCYTPIMWAVEKGVTNGTSTTTFSPNEICTVGQILTFIWRANGQPTPTISNPFTNVTDKDYFLSAACWAYEKGLVSGNIFNANAPCTRSMAVTYLWKLSDSVAVSPASFTDVPVGAEYASAVAWAVKNGITSGTTSTTFSPNQPCTRGQIVTFLHRFSGSPTVTSANKISGGDFYVSHPNIPDFGTFSGVSLIDSDVKGNTYYYFYNNKDILNANPNKNVLSDYEKQLTSNGFSYYSTFESSDGPLTLYSNGDTVISIGTKDDTLGILIRPLSDLTQLTTSDGKYYSQCPGVPDFGAITGTLPTEISPRSDGGWTYTYNKNVSKERLDNYSKILSSEGFKIVNAMGNGYGSNFVEVTKGNITILFGETDTSIMIAVYFD